MTTETIDLSEFLPTHELRLQIIAPNGKPTGWIWTLAAANHPKNIAFNEARAAKNLERAKVLREAQMNGVRYEAETITPEASRREDAQWIVARTLDWTPIKIGDQTYTFSDKATEDLIIKPEMLFVMLQISKALNDDARFMKRSAEA